MRRCIKISGEDLNSGYGNDLFQKIARGQREMKPRVRAAIRNLEFSENKAPEQKRSDARQLVNVLDIASDGGFEKMNWSRLKQKVNLLISEGLISQELYDDVFVNRENARHNQAIVGFVVKYPNAETSEGTGNDFYFDIFNSQISLDARARIVDEAFVVIDLSRRQARVLAREMIDYADRYTIPETWDDVTEMLLDIAADGNGLSHRDVKALTGTFEQDSRSALGFDISGQTCSHHTVTDYYNKEVQRTSRSVTETQKISYDLKIKGVNLIKGENENINVSLSVLEGPKVSQQGRYHRLSLSSQGIRNGHAKLSITAKRQKKAVQNSISIIEYRRVGNTMNIYAKDMAYDPAIGGETWIHISPIEDRFVVDNIHHPTVKLKMGGVEGLPKDVLFASIKVPMEKDSRKLSFKYRLERKGSVFFRDEVSGSKQTDRLDFR